MQGLKRLYRTIQGFPKKKFLEDINGGGVYNKMGGGRFFKRDKKGGELFTEMSLLEAMFDFISSLKMFVLDLIFWRLFSYLRPDKYHLIK